MNILIFILVCILFFVVGWPVQRDMGTRWLIVIVIGIIILTLIFALIKALTGAEAAFIIPSTI